MATLVVFVIALFSRNLNILALESDPRQVYVDGLNGTDSEECLSSNSSEEPCQTLSYVAENLKFNSVTIIVQSDVLNLTKVAQFENLEHLSISGDQSSIHCSQANAGLSFVNVRDLNIQSLSVYRCGAEMMSTNLDPQTNMTECINVSVYILNCSDVTAEDLNITSSNGRGLSMYDTSGTVNIINCVFADNHAYESPPIGGGGLYIEFTFCGLGFVSNCSEHQGINDSMYHIINCTFSKNTASFPTQKETVISPAKPLSVPRIGKGGGLYISIGSISVNNTFIIKNCIFRNNSATLVGGGMLANFLNSVQNNTISVSGTSFVDNHCTHELNCSAGLVVGLMFYNKSRVTGIVPMNNIFECHRCRFEGNTGGGLIIFASKDNICPYRHGKILFSHSKWSKNTSPMGAAVFMTPGIWDYTHEGCLPVPVFSNCSFEKNSARNSQPSYINVHNITVTSLGFGTMSATQFKVQFKGNITFSHNQGTAVHASNSVLDFSEGSTVTFINNTAHKGGAIAMYGTSVLQFRDNSIFRFIGNNASSVGGAIYVEFTAASHPAYRNCFVQPASQVCSKATNVTFYFEGNHAKAYGASIFATTFRSCAFLCHDNATKPIDILGGIADFHFNDSLPLATQPTNFTLESESSVKLIPGTEYHLPLLVKDETGIYLNGIVYEASVNATGNVSVAPAFNQVSNNTIKLLGAPNDVAELHLQASESDVVLSFTVSFTDCRPGYILNGSECSCGVPNYFGLVGCDGGVKLKHGYWMGYCSDTTGTELCTTYCPHGFCSYNSMNPTQDLHPLPKKSSLLDKYICGPTRTGRLCGKCVSNYSVYYHSEKYTCGDERLCHFGWLFYLLSEVLPLLILFIAILYFNVSFTDGNINCFVLYAQVLDSLAIDFEGAIKTKKFIHIIHLILKLIYRPFNLDFFTSKLTSFCLWKGADVLDVMIMKATTVGLALVLVLSTILLVRCRCARFRIFSKFHTPQSVLVRGLSAFFVLCYSQAAKIIFHILTFFCLYSKKMHCKEKVVYLVGYMNYLQGDHIKYAVVAIIALVIMIIIPPLLLLIYPLLFKLLGYCKLSESRLTAFLWRLMPIQILDAFQSSFKDRYRFFAGLYFFYRASILAAYAYSETVFQFYSTVQLHLILILAVHATFQPYKMRMHNIIDSLLFTNLAIINGITLFNYTRKDYMERYISQFAVNSMEFIQAILILLPFLCIIVHSVMEFVRRRRKKREGDNDLPPLRSSEHTPLIVR